MSSIKILAEEHFDPDLCQSDHEKVVQKSVTASPNDTQTLRFEEDVLFEWLEKLYYLAEVLKLISFESVYILKSNFGQLLHL